MVLTKQAGLTIQVGKSELDVFVAYLNWLTIIGEIQSLPKSGFLNIFD